MHHDLSARAAALVASLGLQPHPEGGFYRELFRSAARVRTARGSGRSALTVIHFLLARGQFSALHRVRADEAWHFVEGQPLELLWVHADGPLQRVLLGPLDAGAVPVAVVPSDAWQAARPVGDHALVACDVAPGFDFEDFTLLREVPDERDALFLRHPSLRELG
jgi:hypothetical protein